MAITFTTTAYSVIPKKIHAGIQAVSWDLTVSVSLSSSANSAVILGPRIPNGAVLVGMIERHSTGSATCPVDIGYDDTLSVLASQWTQATSAVPTGLQIPHKVSVTSSTDQGYVTIKLGLTPGTDTAGFRTQGTIYYAFDQTS
jgi:hypothetical protein